MQTHTHALNKSSPYTLSTNPLSVTATVTITVITSLQDGKTKNKKKNTDQSGD